MRLMVFVAALSVVLMARADYWMPFCKTLGGRQYAQVGYVKPAGDGFVTMNAATLTTKTLQLSQRKRCNSHNENAATLTMKTLQLSQWALY